MRREVDKIHAYGAELVVIGNGNLQFANAFRNDLKLETPLYVDTTRASYRALGMKRGMVRTLGSLRMWANVLRARSKGFRQQHGVQGDAWQLGGVLVVLPDGRVPYRYISAVAGDHPSVNKILDALESAP